jgi:hypothetical protein
MRLLHVLDHTETWPESLMELTPLKLCKAFEEAQREEFCRRRAVEERAAQQRCGAR